jgi:transposase
VISDCIALSEQQQVELSRIAHARSLPAGYVFRARLILMLADGVSYNSIKQRLRKTAPTISRWKQRSVAHGLDGWDTAHPGQKPFVLTARPRARILAATRKPPSDGSTHWSCRKLAAALNVGKDIVYRVWQEAGLKPHRLERYVASNDPDFETKAADIIGLYLNPSEHPAVFCIDEKTAIQALDRLDPVLPLSPGRIERHGFEYYRHGTLSIYAALETATCRVHGKTTARHTSRTSSHFSKKLWPAHQAADSHHPRQSVRAQNSFRRSVPVQQPSRSVPHILPGSTRSNFGSAKLSATSLLAASSPPCLTWPERSNATSELTR